MLYTADNSLHVASFAQGDTDKEGRLKLTTKYNGTPAPNYAKFAFQVCSSDEYIYGKREEPESTQYSGFLSPNGHRQKALALGDQVHAGSDSFGGATYDLVSDVKAAKTFTQKSLNEFSQNPTRGGRGNTTSMLNLFVIE